MSKYHIIYIRIYISNICYSHMFHPVIYPLSCYGIPSYRFIVCIYIYMYHLFIYLIQSPVCHRRPQGLLLVASVNAIVTPFWLLKTPWTPMNYHTYHLVSPYVLVCLGGWTPYESLEAPLGNRLNRRLPLRHCHTVWLGASSRKSTRDEAMKHQGTIEASRFQLKSSHKGWM